MTKELDLWEKRNSIIEKHAGMFSHITQDMEELLIMELENILESFSTNTSMEAVKRYLNRKKQRLLNGITYEIEDDWFDYWIGDTKPV